MKAALVLLALLLPGAALAQQRITAEGCPLTGVTANCLAIKGDDGKLYDITAIHPRPQPGRAIRLSGNRSGRYSVCQQGVPLSDIIWSYSSNLRCGR